MAKTKGTDENTLESFAGFESESEIDFFETGPAEETTLDPIDDQKEEEESEDEKPATTSETVEGETEEEINFFDVDDEPSDDDPEDIKPATPADTSDTTHIGTLNYLKEKGLIEYELEEGEELTEQLAEQIVEDNFDERIESRVTELFADIPEPVRNIVKYAIDGGDVTSLLTSMAQKSISPINEDMDLEDEANQLLVVTTQRLADGDDKETAESYAEYLKESGKLKGIAEKQHSAIISKQKAEERKKLNDVAEKKKQDKINQRKFKEEVSGIVSKVENLNGLPITRVDKRELPNYMADRTVKLDDGRQVTAMQRDLFAAMQDKDKSVLLAKLLKSDFNFDSIEKATKTKFTKEVKKNVTRSGGIKAKKTDEGKKDLASYF